ncbi:sensor histidine kinase [Myceligenerans xiligouense]|uniref:histidine kinase n=1 Tax=Myceligenerans xiligouense TaxID=253184 RepID=A0A3N4ZCU8_9MICO|nr:sensor histidine kinase [Myceligenerans xiligouense]RPF23292.1 histidine kinase [Myceligenerans xiligouense]
MSLEQEGRPLQATADRGPLDRRRPRVFVATAVLGGALLGSLGAGYSQPEARGFDVGAFALLLVAPLAIVLLLPRRPATAVVASVGATGSYLLAGYAWGPAILEPVVLLTVVVLCGPARRGRMIAWAGVALLLATVVASSAIAPPVFREPGWGGPPGRSGVWGPHNGPDGGGWEPTVGLSPAGFVAGAAWTVVPLLAAGAVRDRATRRTAARAAARETAAERERTAVTAERLRIARELHDVLAHSLSGINVQAGVGLHLLDRDPGQARTALTAIRDTSRDALAEVRTVLGIVRGEAGEEQAIAGTERAGAPEGPGPPSSTDTGGAPLAPSWDLSALERLAAQTRAEGLAVTLDVDASGLPDRVAGAVHRVVQEALTNVRRHAAGATRVTVSVRRSGTSCQVVVSDDGRGAPGTGDGVGAGTGGYGLRGMRERVEALGGIVDAGPDDVGWLVRASFPLPLPAAGHDADTGSGHETDLTPGHAPNGDGPRGEHA